MGRVRLRKHRRLKALLGCAGMVLLNSLCVGIASGREGSHDAGAARLQAVTRVGTPSALVRLMHHGADPDARDPITRRTLLETAILAGRRDQIPVLLEAGANPDLTDSLGNTALHLAAQTNQPWVALELLKAGAAPDILNEQGKTFLAYLFLMRDDLLSQDAREGKRALAIWLARRGFR